MSKLEARVARAGIVIPFARRPRPRGGRPVPSPRRQNRTMENGQRGEATLLLLLRRGGGRSHPAVRPTERRWNCMRMWNMRTNMNTRRADSLVGRRVCLHECFYVCVCTFAWLVYLLNVFIGAASHKEKTAASCQSANPLFLLPPGLGMPIPLNAASSFSSRVFVMFSRWLR